MRLAKQLEDIKKRYLVRRHVPKRVVTPTRPRGLSSTQWFQGGNLHSATVAQWKKASYQNKLATASDWLTATKWKGHLNSPGDFDRLKLKAQLLVECVDETVVGLELGEMRVAEIAVALHHLSNDFSP